MSMMTSQIDAQRLVELKASKVTTEKRISELQQLISAQRTHKDVIRQDRRKHKITSREYYTAYVQIEKQLHLYTAELNQQQQTLQAIRQEIIYSDRANIHLL